MRNTLNSLWSDSAGVVVTAEIVVVSTVLVLGVIVGLSNLQTGVLHELSDVGNAVDHLSQSYAYMGFRSVSPQKIKARYSGSAFFDQDEGAAGGLTYVCSTVACSNAPVTVAPAPAAPYTAPAPAPVVDPCPVTGDTTGADCPPGTTSSGTYVDPGPVLVYPGTGAVDCDTLGPVLEGPGLQGPSMVDPIPVY